MARIVALSSFVSAGHVGLNAVVPPLEALGHHVTSLPTVVLSNPAHARHVAGFTVAADVLGQMIEALDQNGWLRETDAVLTGYLPTADHVSLAMHLIAEVRRSGPDALILVDPILGDEPKGLYIAEAAARAIRDNLVPQADLVLPNIFELGWLTGRPVCSSADAVAAARMLGRPAVVATSVPYGPGRLASVLVHAEEAMATVTAEQTGVPHGTGDVLSGLMTGYMAAGAAASTALARSSAVLRAIISASLNTDDLHLAAGLDRLGAAVPLPLERAGSD